MGRKTKCPRCGNVFQVHGDGYMPGDEVRQCFDCDRIFNPRNHFIEGPDAR